MEIYISKPDCESLAQTQNCFLLDIKIRNIAGEVPEFDKPGVRGFSNSPLWRHRDPHQKAELLQDWTTVVH